MTTHLCSSVFIINPENLNILLVHHKKHDKWVQPGGHIEDGESIEAAAIREAKEETGLDIKLLGERFPEVKDYIRPMGIQRTVKDNTDLYVSVIYAAIPTEEKLVSLNYSESNSIGWFSRNELEDLPIFDDIIITYDSIIKEYFS